MEVESICRYRRTGGLDLAPEILGFEDEELVAVRQVGQDVLFEAEHFVLLSVLQFLREECRIQVFRGGIGDETGSVCTTLDGGSNGGEDCFRRKEINAAIDQIGDVRFGLFDVVEDLLGLRVRDNAAKVCGCFVADPRTEDDGLCILLLEELEHLLKRKGAADVGIEDEEAVRATFEDDISEMVQTAGCA